MSGGPRETLTAASISEYEEFEGYLDTVFALIEGMADVPQAQQILSGYLARRRGRIDRNLEELLIELFFAKCRRNFLGLE